MDIETAFPDNFSWQAHVNEIRQRGSLIFEGVQKRKNSTTFPVEVNISYVVINTREYMVTVARDITWRKSAEENLRQSEKRFRSVMETVPAILWALDSSGTLVFSEGRALAVLGLKAGELVGQSVFEIYKNDIKAVSLIQRGLEGEEFSDEVEVGRHNWSNRYVPHPYKDGKVIGLIGISSVSQWT